METFLYYFQWFKTNYPRAISCRRPLEGAKLIINKEAEKAVHWIRFRNEVADLLQ